MAPQKTAQVEPAHVGDLERRLAAIELELEALEKERDRVQAELEDRRRELTMCPKCGRDESFLTDEGGVLIHVLEDRDDTDLLTPGKPLYCPTCGEVFLFRGAPARAVAAPRPPARVRRSQVARRRA